MDLSREARFITQYGTVGSELRTRIEAQLQAQLELSREHDPARGDFNTTTPRGKSRFEMQNRGPMRPGKTRRDGRAGFSRRRRDA